MATNIVKIQTNKTTYKIASMAFVRVVRVAGRAAGRTRRRPSAGSAERRHGPTAWLTIFQLMLFRTE